MAKIKDPAIFSSVFKIDPNILKSKGIFDPVLNIDTKLFIDPLLLEKSAYSMINTDAVKLYKNHYIQIISLLEESKQLDDVAWRAARQLIQRKEIAGTCLGYGINSTSGRSLPPKLQQKILVTAKEIIDIGIKKPELFILLPLFEEGVGPDTISDITTAAIQTVLYNFTATIAKELGIKTSKVTFRGEKIEIIQNPLKLKVSPVVLIPKDILRRLPFASSWEEIEHVVAFNHTLRNRVNQYIGGIWRARTKTQKAKEREKILRSKSALEALLDVINNSNVKPYDFKTDANGLTIWRDILTSVYKEYPLEIRETTHDRDGLQNVVKVIIDQFKFLIEQKGLNKLLWNKPGSPNHEEVSQLLFYSIAYSYCKANNLDINPEMDTGIGYVDFKFSHGFKKRLIVEIKHSYNPNIITGFSTQLKLYKDSEETCYGYYVIIDVGRLGRKYDNLIKLCNENQLKADIFYIDGAIKKSASKR